ncbi:MAG TPA: substrate-binding domain-containing protein, partial [Actinomycetota bacterium]|nr:substrate-binding domain-containing protein [Actinomycetota bacterium]
MPFVAACSNDPSPPATTEITVFAAASLQQTFTELGRQFEAAHPGTTVKFSFGGSSTLVAQL